MSRELDRLVAAGAISGYTRERSIAYLAGRRPTLAYSMYAEGATSRTNQLRFTTDMEALGGEVSPHPQWGQLGVGRGRISSTRQVRLVVEFGAQASLREAVALVGDRYLDGPGRVATPGSWVYPDVRVTGSAARLRGTFRATAHFSNSDPGVVVVLSRDSTPPLTGMACVPVLLLECWQRLLADAAA